MKHEQKKDVSKIIAYTFLIIYFIGIACIMYMGMSSEVKSPTMGQYKVNH